MKIALRAASYIVPERGFVTVVDPPAFPRVGDVIEVQRPGTPDEIDPYRVKEVVWVVDPQTGELIKEDVYIILDRP